MMRLAALALVLTIGAGSAWAAEQLPSIVSEAIAESGRTCDATKQNKGFLSRRDMTGDGRVSFILDYEYFECDGSASLYCGSAGCVKQIFIALPAGDYVKAYEENAQRIDFVKKSGRSAMVVHLHGSSCGRAGASECRAILYWNGSRFSPAH